MINCRLPLDSRTNSIFDWLHKHMPNSPYPSKPRWTSWGDKEVIYTETPQGILANETGVTRLFIQFKNGKDATIFTLRWAI